MDPEMPGEASAPHGARLMEQVRSVARERGLRPRTIETYCSWIVRYVRYCGLRHPRVLDTSDGDRFLDSLSGEGRLGASTVGQARAALGFLYRYVLAEPGRRPLRAIARGGTVARLALSPEEAKRLLVALSGRNRLAAALMYGTGIRLSECISLRAGDAELRRRRVHVYDPDGRRRAVALPITLLDSLERQIEGVRRQHLRDARRGGGWVVARGTLADVGAFAVRQWRSSWLFPARRQHRDRVADQWRRDHVSATTIQRAIAAAARQAGLAKRVTAGTLRHSCAIQLLRNGYDVYVVRELLGHRDLSTTLRYLGEMDRRSTVRSPLDQLSELSRAGGTSFADARRSTD